MNLEEAQQTHDALEAAFTSLPKAAVQLRALLRRHRNEYRAAINALRRVLDDEELDAYIGILGELGPGVRIITQEGASNIVRLNGTTGVLTKTDQGYEVWLNPTGAASPFVIVREDD